MSATPKPRTTRAASDEMEEFRAQMKAVVVRVERIERALRRMFPYALEPREIREREPSIHDGDSSWPSPLERFLR